MQEIHSSPLQKRYHAHYCSLAYLFHICFVIALIICPFVIAYATGDFWKKSGTYYEQPTVDFAHKVVIVAFLSDGSYVSWSTVPEYNDLAGNSHLRIPKVQTYGIDDNNDAITDTIRVTLTLPLLQDEEVVYFDVLLFYNVQFLEKVVMTMDSLIHVSGSNPNSPVGYYVNGDLLLHQVNPVSTTSIRTAYSTSVLTADTLKSVSDTYTQTILESSFLQNETLRFDAMEPVWTYGEANSFTVSILARIPNQAVRYIPNALETLKAAWIQYFAVLVVFLYPLNLLRQFVFENHLVGTRVTLDTQPAHKMHHH